MAFSASSPLAAAAFTRQREREEALSAAEAEAASRGALLFRAKAGLEALHAELQRVRVDAAAYQTEARLRSHARPRFRV